MWWCSAVGRTPRKPLSFTPRAFAGAAAVHYRRCASIVAITPEIEGDERFIPAGRPLENFGMA